jgi:hypothetical protein
MGNHPGVDGPIDERMNPVQNKEELNAYLAMGEVRYVASRQQMAMEFIRKNPRRFVELTGERIVSFWTAQRAAMVWWPTVCAVLAWVSLALMMRNTRRAVAAPFFSALVLYPVPYYITHAESYYRFPIEPLVLLLVANMLFVLLDKAAGVKEGEAGAPDGEEYSADDL